MSVREDLIAQIKGELDKLNDEQIATLLRSVRIMKSNQLPDDYDPDNDPAVGFFSGTPDLASQSTEILRREFGIKPSPKDE